MALESWPELLNSLAQRGTFAHKPGDPNSRSENDKGPQRTRTRYTSVPDNYAFQVLMTSFEKLVFDGFFKNIISFGKDWFIMPVVIGNDYIQSDVRILKDGVSFNDAGYDKYLLTLNIEIRNLDTFDAVTAYIVGNYGYNPGAFDPLQPIVNELYPHSVNGVLNFNN